MTLRIVPLFTQLVQPAALVAIQYSYEVAPLLAPQFRVGLVDLLVAPLDGLVLPNAPGAFPVNVDVDVGVGV